LPARETVVVSDHIEARSLPSETSSTCLGLLHLRGIEVTSQRTVHLLLALTPVRVKTCAARITCSSRCFCRAAGLVTCLIVSAHNPPHNNIVRTAMLGCSVRPLSGEPAGSSWRLRPEARPPARN